MAYFAPDDTYRRIKATEITWYDPGAVFSGGNPAENGGGTAITVSLVGGRAIASLVIPDFAASCYGVFALTDWWGRPVSGDPEWAFKLRIRFGTAPAVADNVYVAALIVNESNITGGTVDGTQWIYDASAANVNPRVRQFVVSNGTTASAVNVAANAAVAGLSSGLARSGISSSGAPEERSLVTFGLNTARGLLAGAIPAGLPNYNTALRYGVLAFDRTLAADVDIITFDVILELERFLVANP